MSGLGFLRSFSSASKMAFTRRDDYNNMNQLRNLSGVSKSGPSKVRLEKGKEVKWCACGLSGKQPFCDGSHAKTEKKPIAFKAPETKEFSFCNCKTSKNKPFCDGSHARI